MFVSEQLQVDGLRSSLHAPVLRKKVCSVSAKASKSGSARLLSQLLLGSYVNVYLCEGDEEQLFMCVSESRQGSLWTMFPHPLLIRLQSVRPAATTNRKLESCGDLRNSGSAHY